MKNHLIVIVLLSSILYNSCSNKEISAKSKIKTILLDEVRIDKSFLNNIFIIQDNSCMMCFENLKNEADSHNKGEMAVLFISKYKNESNLSFLDLSSLEKEQIYLTSNKDLINLLLKSVGGFSKGYYLVKIKKNKDIFIEALN